MVSDGSLHGGLESRAICFGRTANLGDQITGNRQTRKIFRETRDNINAMQTIFVEVRNFRDETRPRPVTGDADGVQLILKSKEYESHERTSVGPLKFR